MLECVQGGDVQQQLFLLQQANEGQVRKSDVQIRSQAGERG